MPTLEYATEEIALQLLRLRPMLASLPIVHYDRQGKAEKNRVVLRAVKGPRRTDGPGGYDLELSVEYITVKRQTPAQNEVVMAEIESVFEPDALRAAGAAGVAQYPAFNYFSELHFEPGQDGDRENKDKHRQRKRTFQVIAKLK